MSTTTKSIMITSAAAFLALMTTLGAAEAAESGERGAGQRHYDLERTRGSHDGNAEHFNDNNGRHFGIKGRHSRVFRRGFPGFRVYSGENSGCSYAYRQWQATGSRYWRERYYDCRNG